MRCVPTRAAATMSAANARDCTPLSVSVRPDTWTSEIARSIEDIFRANQKVTVYAIDRRSEIFAANERDAFVNVDVLSSNVRNASHRHPSAQPAEAHPTQWAGGRRVLRDALHGRAVPRLRGRVRLRLARGGGDRGGHPRGGGRGRRLAPRR